MTSMPLSPILNEWIRSLISPSHQRQLSGLLAEYGSPLNIHHLPSFIENVDAYNEVFDELNLDGKVFYARKANKCLSLLKMTNENNYGVDTASLNELRQTLNVGVAPHNIVLTAAIKSDELLAEAISNDVVIIIDNEDEVDAISKVSKSLGKVARVGVRISGFTVDGEKLYSRFGVDIENAFDFISSLDRQSNTLSFQGLHFHLDGYSIEQRRSALRDCLDLAVKLGNVEFIDIGGGLLMNYLEDPQEWRIFDLNLRASLLNTTREITYKNDGLGYEKHGSGIIGELKTYPYYNEVNGGKALRLILEGENADMLSKLGIQVRLEPGRSLLSQVGITAAKVIHRKKDSRGDYHVGLEMNMTQMLSGSRDFLVDPIVIYQKEKCREGVEVYFTGAYCLERDVLLKRKIKLDRLPDRGDIVVFPNTAGYMMHFFESEAHQFPLAKNVFIDLGNKTSLNEKLDDIDQKPAEIL